MPNFCLVLLLSVSPLALAKPGLLDFFKSDCKKAKFDNPISCAVLYDDDGCEGWELGVNTGYTDLPFRYQNDAEAVAVKPGCLFVGWDHSDPSPNKRGRSVTVDARSSKSPVAKDLDGSKELDDDISAVDCTCNTSG